MSNRQMGLEIFKKIIEINKIDFYFMNMICASSRVITFLEVNISCVIVNKRFPRGYELVYSVHIHDAFSMDAWLRGGCPRGGRRTRAPPDTTLTALWTIFQSHLTKHSFEYNRRRRRSWMHPFFFL